MHIRYDQIPSSSDDGNNIPRDSLPDRTAQKVARGLEKQGHALDPEQEDGEEIGQEYSEE